MMQGARMFAKSAGISALITQQRALIVQLVVKRQIRSTIVFGERFRFVFKGCAVVWARIWGPRKFSVERRWVSWQSRTHTSCLKGSAIPPLGRFDVLGISQSSAGGFWLLTLTFSHNIIHQNKCALCQHLVETRFRTVTTCFIAYQDCFVDVKMEDQMGTGRNFAWNMGLRRRNALAQERR